LEKLLKLKSYNFETMGTYFFRILKNHKVWEKIFPAYFEISKIFSQQIFLEPKITQDKSMGEKASPILSDF
jgi:hypothetical protein